MSIIGFNSGTTIVGSGCFTAAAIQNPYLYNNGAIMSKKRNFSLAFEETENGFVLNTTENKFNSDYNQYQQISKKFVFNDTNELIKAVSDIIRNK